MDKTEFKEKIDLMIQRINQLQIPFTEVSVISRTERELQLQCSSMIWGRSIYIVWLTKEGEAKWGQLH